MDQGLEIEKDTVQIFRMDPTNVGDWYCRPGLYFPLRPGKLIDIMDLQGDISGERAIIVGGGGLGREIFRQQLGQLVEQARDAVLIAWGVGCDTLERKSPEPIGRDMATDFYKDYFDQFDEVGHRVFCDELKFRYVPCASCMHELFFKYRDVKPSKLVGFYSHKRMPLVKTAQSDWKQKLGLKKKVKTRIKQPVFESHPFTSFSEEDNNGADIEAKIAFMADHEYIVTNSYHGVYWATLLNRKVLCVPFKSGLYSFKHTPAYVTRNEIGEEDLHRAQSYPDALEDSRKHNIEFYNYLTSKYGDI